MKNYEVITTTIGGLQEGDQVIGTDGLFHDIKILPIHIPNTMYEIEFSNGTVKCSGDHQWTLYGVTNMSITIDSDTIFKEREDLVGLFVGSVGGPEIVSIKQIEPLPSRCINLIGCEDMLFEIFTEVVGNPTLSSIDKCEFDVIRND